jgi:hypothetical protein
MERNKIGLACVIGCLLIVALLILIPVLINDTSHCDSSPQYFLWVENVSSGEYQYDSREVVQEKFTRDGYQIREMNESVFNLIPSLHNAFSDPHSQVFIDSGDVKKFSDLTRNSVFTFNGNYYLIVISHYDRADC